MKNHSIKVPVGMDVTLFVMRDTACDRVMSVISGVLRKVRGNRVWGSQGERMTAHSFLLCWAGEETCEKRDNGGG